MDTEGGDVDFLLMDISQQSRKVLTNVLFARDRSICLKDEDSISVFLNAGPESKSLIMKSDYETESDLSSIESKEECIFFCVGNEEFIIVSKTEKSELFFFLINQIKYGKRVVTTYITGNFSQVVSKRIHKICIDVDSKLLGKEIPKWENYEDINKESKALWVLGRRIQQLIISLLPGIGVDTHGQHYRSVYKGKQVLLPIAPNWTVNNATIAPLPGRDHELPRVSQSYAYRSETSGLATRDPISEPLSLPKHPEYAEERTRIETFHNWLYEKVQDPIRLSRAGFFWTKMLDLVRCFFCGLGLKDFSNTDDPLLEHVRYSETCGFLIHTEGKTKINDIKAMLVQTDPEFCRRQQWQDIQRRPAPITSQSTFKHPSLSPLDARLKTFKTNWPRTIVQQPEQLARAGFYFTGTGDIVRCFACDGGLQKWDPTDDPWIEHCRWFPACPFVLSEKGEEYIRLVQHAVERGDETRLEAAIANPSQDELVNGMDRLDVGVTGSQTKSHRDMMRQLEEMGFREELIQSALTRLEHNKNKNLDIYGVVEEIENIQKSPAYLREENERLKNMLKCEKCKVADREALFLPCKHLRMCMACSENVLRCPLCNENIQHKIKTYIA